jgi:hypothetical protein
MSNYPRTAAGTLQKTDSREGREAKTATPADQLLPAQGSVLPPRTDWAAPVFVWGVWAAMVLAALWFVGIFGRNIPFSDEWYYVPEMTGEQSVTPASIWSGHSEHRIPIAKVLFLSVLKVTGGSFRAGMVINVLALSMLAVALILTARKLRGRLDYSDAFFPLALLNWGNWLNLMMWFQFHQILAMVLVAVLLWIALRNRTQLPIRAAVLAGACLMLLPLNGAGGLAFVPALALWLAYAGYLRWHSPEPHGKRVALMIWGMVGVALLLVPIYFLGLDKSASFPSPGLRGLLRTAVQFQALSLGPAVRPFWQYYGLGILGLLFISGSYLVWVWYRRPQERLRALGLLSAMGGAGCLALGVGWGRSGGGYYYALEAFHYVIFALPALYCVYFTWVIYHPGTAGRFVQTCLLLLLCSLFWQNTQLGFEDAKYLQERRDWFEHDLRAGLPPLALSQRYGRTLYRPDDPFGTNAETLADRLRMLRREGWEPFQHLQEAPSTPPREVYLPVTVNQTVRVNDSTSGERTGPVLEIALTKAQRVDGVRLKCSYENSPNHPMLRVSWSNGEGVDFAHTRHFAQEQPTLEEHTITVWIYDTIDRFRVSPGTDLGAFRISEIVLLLPPDD